MYLGGVLVPCRDLYLFQFKQSGSEPFRPRKRGNPSDGFHLLCPWYWLLNVDSHLSPYFYFVHMNVCLHLGVCTLSVPGTHRGHWIPCSFSLQTCEPDVGLGN